MNSIIQKAADEASVSGDYLDPTNNQPPPGWEHLTPDQIADLGEIGRLVYGGLSVVPIRLGGKKQPAVRRWKTYQQRHPNPMEAFLWQRQKHAWAIVCGTVSGGLEILDFDDGDLWSPWYSSCGPIVERYDLPRVYTPSRGWHIYWRCETISGNLKLAKNEAGQTLVETRGQGGYALAPGNPQAAHASGRLYVQTAGLRVHETPVIPPGDRVTLLKAAAKFDRSGIKEHLIAERAKQLLNQRYSPEGRRAGKGQPVWEVFKARATWSEVLEPHGWTQAGSTFWTRPGGVSGAHSASINRAKNGTSLLCVFSANAGPLAPIAGDHATHDLFTAYALLSHDGDRRAAARELRRKGFGG